MREVDFGLLSSREKCQYLIAELENRDARKSVKNFRKARGQIDQAVKNALLQIKAQSENIIKQISRNEKTADTIEEIFVSSLFFFETDQK